MYWIIKDSRENNSFADESFFKNNAPLKQRLIEWEKAAPEPVHRSKIKILRSGDASAKADAAIQLRKAGSSAQGAILALLETLYDPRVDKQVYVDGGVPRLTITVSPAAEAAETLARMGEPAVEPLVAVLKNGDAGSRKTVVQALAPVKDPRIAEALIPILDDENAQIRDSAILALGTVKDQHVIDLLIAALKDGGRRQEGAIQALGLIRAGQAVEPLLSILKGNDPDTRKAVIQALGQIKDRRAIESLIAVQKDPDPDIREAVVLAFGQMKDPDVLKPLISALSDDDVRIRDSATRALKAFKDQLTVDVLTALAKDPQIRTRRSAIQLLAQIRDPRIVEPPDRRFEGSGSWYSAIGDTGIGSNRRSTRGGPCNRRFERYGSRCPDCSYKSPGENAKPSCCRIPHCCSRGQARNCSH